MEEYWAHFNKNIFGAIVYHEKLFYETNKEVADIYKQYYIIFPGDMLEDLAIVALVVLFYSNGDIINNTHAYIIDILLNMLSFEAVKYAIKKQIQYFTNRLKRLQSGKLLRLEQIKKKKNNLIKGTKISLKNLEQITDYIEQNEDTLNELFKGRYDIVFDRSQILKHKRKSLRERFRHMKESDITKTVALYKPVDPNLDRIFEVWLRNIKTRYSPLSVCISNKHVFMFSSTNRREKLTRKEINEIYKINYQSRRSEYSISDPSQMLIIPKQVIDEIDHCEVDKKFLIELRIAYDDYRDNHANALIIDKREKIIYRMEPEGVDEYGDKVFEEQLTTYYPYFKYKKYKYAGTIKTCPKINTTELFAIEKIKDNLPNHLFSTGTQNIEAMLENELKLPKDFHGAGTCYMWSLLFFEYVIRYKDSTPIQIYNHILSKGNLTFLIYAYIAEIIDDYKQMLKDGYPFENKELLHRSPQNMKDIVEFHSGIFKNFGFDVLQLSHVGYLYNLIYNGHENFDNIIKNIFDYNLSYIDKDKLINVNELLNSLKYIKDYNNKDIGLIHDILVIHHSENEHDIFPQAHLPSANIHYYKDLVRDSFLKILHGDIFYLKNNEMDKDLEYELTKIFEKYFNEPLY